MKLKKQPALACPFYNIGASARPMVAFSGFFESHEPRIVPPHCNGHQNGHQSGYILHCCFVCCCPGGRRDDASSGFRCSPGHDASRNAVYITSMPPHGHQNKAATEVHLFVADTFLLGVIVAKDHVMAH